MAKRKKSASPQTILSGILFVLVLISIGIGYATMRGKAAQFIYSLQTPQKNKPFTVVTKTKLIHAGLASDSVFSRYTIETPSGWADQHETMTASDKLTLSKKDSNLTIYQAVFGGGGCSYTGEPQAEMAQTFTNFTEIIGKSAQFRRSWTEDPRSIVQVYTVCQKATGGSYGYITSFGRIDISVPKPPDNAILSQIDSIVASLTKE